MASNRLYVNRSGVLCINITHHYPRQTYTVVYLYETIEGIHFAYQQDRG